MTWDEIYHLFENIRDISEQQLLLARRIKDEPEVTETMLKLMERRRKITQKIDALSAEFSGYNGNNSNNEREQIMAIINDIQKYDRQSQKMVEAGREQAGEKLGNVRHSQKAYDAYVPNAIYTEGWFFDKKK